MSYYLLNLHFIALYMNKSTQPVLVSMLVNKIFCAIGNVSASFKNIFNIN